MKAKRYLLIMMSLLLVSGVASADKKKLGENIKAQLTNDKTAVAGQKNIDSIDTKTQSMVDEYRLTLRKIESTKIYNKQLLKLIKSQDLEKISVVKQIDSIKGTNAEIVPLMLNMVKTLDQLILVDTPFLPKERKDRVSGLNEMMNRADVSTSEKYRRILEAYQVENDYGKTIEAYRGSIENEGQVKSVDFLRIGRLLLMYQTLDGKNAGLWDNKKKSWTALGDEYKKSIRKGLRVARKQTPPNMLKLPVFAAESI
jgi:hypothetical protein